MPAFSRTARAGSWRARAGSGTPAKCRTTSRPRTRSRAAGSPASTLDDATPACDAARRRPGGRARRRRGRARRAASRAPAEEAGRAGDEELHAAPQVARDGVLVVERRRDGPRGAAGRLAALGQRGDVGHRERLGGDVVGRSRLGHRAVEQQPRGVVDVDDADRRRPPPSSGSGSPRGEPAELVDDGLRVGAVVLDRARPVDDPEPQLARPKPPRRACMPSASSA